VPFASLFQRCDPENFQLVGQNRPLIAGGLSLHSSDRENWEEILKRPSGERSFGKFFRRGLLAIETFCLGNVFGHTPEHSFRGFNYLTSGIFFQIPLF